MKFASEVIARARTIIQDETNKRWSLAELCDWVNDGLLAIVTQKPAATAITVPITLKKGTLQQLPSNYAAVLRPVRNISGSVASREPRRSISVVQQDVLDNLNPTWHDEYSVRYMQQVKHFMFDEANPRAFYVYPGNDGTGIIECVLSAIPEAIKPKGNKTQFSSYEVALPMDELYSLPLLDYVLHRAYTKDAQFVGNAQRAALHFQQFMNGLGIKLKADTSTSPNIKANVGYSAAGVGNDA